MMVAGRQDCGRNTGLWKAGWLQCRETMAEVGLLQGRKADKFANGKKAWALADSSAVGADRLESMQKGWRQTNRLAAGRQTVSRQKGWRQAEMLAAGRNAGGRQKCWRQAEMLAAGRQFGGRRTDWGVGRKAGGRQTGWRQADRMAASRQTGSCRETDWLLAGRLAAGRLAGGMQTRSDRYNLAGGRQTGRRNTCWRHADRVAAGRKAMCRQIFRLVALKNLLTSILKTISAQTESSEFHIIELEKYLFRDRIFLGVEVCARERKVAL
jgi:hypothetical protein